MICIWRPTLSEEERISCRIPSCSMPNRLMLLTEEIVKMSRRRCNSYGIPPCTLKIKYIQIMQSLPENMTRLSFVAHVALTLMMSMFRSEQRCSARSPNIPSNRVKEFWEKTRLSWSRDIAAIHSCPMLSIASDHLHHIRTQYL